MIMHLTQKPVKAESGIVRWTKHPFSLLYLIMTVLAILWAMAHYRN
jgi:hypothetical protein